MTVSHLTTRATVIFLICLCAIASAADTSEADALCQRVMADRPQLCDPSLDDFARVTILRQWAWSRIPVAVTASNTLDNDSKIDWSHLDAPAIFKLFEQDRGGVFCGGAAHALQRLYETFGYKAWTVNSGDPATSATHVTTLVQIKRNQDMLLCVQDAYFNTMVVDRATTIPLDYFDMLARLKKGQHQSIQTEETDHRALLGAPVSILAAQDIAGRSPQEIALASWTTLPENYSVTTLSDGSLKYTSPRSYKRFLDLLCRSADRKPAWFLAWVETKGHPPDLLYLYLYPLGFAGPDSDAMLAKAKRTAR